MTKVQVRFTDYFAQTIQRMREDGLLLASVGADGKANVMTIGWERWAAFGRALSSSCS